YSHQDNYTRLITLTMVSNAKAFPVTANLTVRTAPSLSAKKVRTVPIGSHVDIVCQTTGDTVQGINIWDKLIDGNFVSDVFVKTGTSGFSPDLPRCKNTSSSNIGSPNNGKINNEGLELIKRFEKFEENFYNDPVGIKTIGYGHACHVNNVDDIKPPITIAQGEALLRKDLVTFEKGISSLTNVSLTSNQFSALVSFAFNLGCNTYKKSTLRKKINEGDIEGASLEFGKYIYGGGKILPGLVRRREAERALFSKDN
ncbi:9750_t:CDS:2, partial [Entrophospora sp. SA101]